MIYEALSAGCCVGLLDLRRPKGRVGRLARGIAELEVRGLTFRFDDKISCNSISQACLLNEAERVAIAILRPLYSSSDFGQIGKLYD